MQNLKGFISHLRDHAAQSNEDIIRHSRTLNELRQHLRVAEDNLEHIKEEDANVQLKKKQSSEEVRNLKSAMEHAHFEHSVAKYSNDHTKRLQTALGFESEMYKERPQTPPARRDRQRAGQDGKGYYPHPSRSLPFRSSLLACTLSHTHARPLARPLCLAC